MSRRPHLRLIAPAAAADAADLSGGPEYRSELDGVRASDPAGAADTGFTAPASDAGSAERSDADIEGQPPASRARRGSTSLSARATLAALEDAKLVVLAAEGEPAAAECLYR